MTEGSGRLAIELWGWLMETAIERCYVAQAASLLEYCADKLAAYLTAVNANPNSVFNDCNMH